MLPKRFPNWEEALKSANEVLIDEMLTLLELHYEDLNKNKQKKRSKAIFGSIAYAHRKQLNQKLVLPQRVKQILRCAKDEVSLTKLEFLLQAVRSEMEGQTTVYMTSQEEVEQLARAIENCDTKVCDEVGPGGGRIPEGARLVVEVQGTSLATRREHVAELVRSLEIGTPLDVKMRPFNTARKPPLDPFGRALLKNPEMTVRELLADGTIEEIRDKLLLCLWDALFLSASEQWTKDGVSNTTRQVKQRSWECGLAKANSSPRNLYWMAFVQCVVVCSTEYTQGTHCIIVIQALLSIAMATFWMRRFLKTCSHRFCFGIAPNSSRKNVLRYSTTTRRRTD